MPTLAELQMQGRNILEANPGGRLSRLLPQQPKSQEPFMLAQASSKPKSKPTGLIGELYSAYPKLEQYDIQLIDSSSRQTDHRGGEFAGRVTEFYPPEQELNPYPGKPTIEQFSKDLNAKGVLGEVFSHYLPKVDQVFAKARQKFMGSISEKQKEMLYGDFKHQAKLGLLGENPSFDSWLNKQGGDAFFRGYIANQYPAEFYTEDQKTMFRELLRYLSE